MGIRATIEEGVLVVVAEDEYAFDDVRRAVDAAIASPGFRPPVRMFTDARRSRANPPLAEMRQTADYLGSIREHFLPVWILVAEGALRIGLARMLSMLTEKHGVRLEVCRDLEEATARMRELDFESEPGDD